MSIRIIEENCDVLAEYETVPIAFRVETRFRVELFENGLGGISLIEEAVEEPFIKDYDAIVEERLSLMHARFNLSNWGVLSAFDDKQRVGGALVAWSSPEIYMLEGREDLICLWDLRVAPEYRARGVGHQLFARAVDWAQARSCRLLKVETQNINVPACRFYARQGCELGAVNRFVYPEAMNEIQMIWYRSI